MGEFTGLGALGQVARSVTDIAAAERFWRDVLGMRHLFTFGTLAFFDAGGVRVFLSATGGAGDGAAILYFRVDDIGAAHDALAGRGVVFREAPRMIHRHGDGTEEWMAFFDDNEGRPLAIMSQVRPD